LRPAWDLGAGAALLAGSRGTPGWMGAPSAPPGPGVPPVARDLGRYWAARFSLSTFSGASFSRPAEHRGNSTLQSTFSRRKHSGAVSFPSHPSAATWLIGKPRLFLAGASSCRNMAGKHRLTVFPGWSYSEASQRLGWGVWRNPSSQVPQPKEPKEPRCARDRRGFFLAELMICS